MNNTSTLFNTNTMNNNLTGTSTGGLFNNNTGAKPMGTTNPMTQSTLFSKPAMSGLSGGTNLFNTGQTNSMNKPSGLFNTNTTGQTGLMGMNNKPASTGMFNNNTSSMFKTPSTMPGSNLMNNNLNKPTGMFNTSTTGTSSLFNTQSNSLMGGNKSTIFNKPATQGSTGLFNNTQTTGSSNLFSTQNKLGGVAQNNQMTQMPMQPMMPINLANGGCAMVYLPLNNNTRKALGLGPNMTTNSQGLNGQMNKFPVLGGNNNMFGDASDDSLNSILEKFKKFDNDHYESKSTAFSDRQSSDMFYDSVMSLSHVESPFVVRSATNNYLKAKANMKKILNERKSRKKIRNRMNNLRQSLNRSFFKKSVTRKDSSNLILKNKEEPEEEEKKTNFLKKSNPMNQEKLRETKKFEKKEFTPEAKEVQLTLIFEKFGPHSKWNITVFEDDFIAIIFEKALEMKLIQEHLVPSLTLLHKKNKLILEKRIKDYDWDSDPIVHVYRSSNTDKYFAETSVLPICKREDLMLSPDIVDLSRMTEEELANVSNFIIENEFGRIEFMKDVDLRNANFDEDVIIKNKCVEVYSNMSPEKKPGKGRKMNQEAMITFFNFSRTKGMSLEKFLRVLKKYTKKINAELIGYNEDEKTVRIKVENF
jgi:hypothetical protein